MRVVSLVMLVVYLLLPSAAQAHSDGLVPFFKINGKFAPEHPLQKENIVPVSFIVPQDIPEDAFVVNEPISFIIDTQALSQVYSDDVLRTIQYSWDYGNGDKSSGTENTYAYHKIGSYTLTISAKFADEDVKPQAIETVQMNILPDKSYRLPEPAIRVNHKEVGESPLRVNLRQQVLFEAFIKNKPTKEVKDYQWDLGEGKHGEGQKLIYTYSDNPYLIPAVLKVTDVNGFVVYTFGLLSNNQANATEPSLPINSWGIWILLVQIAVVVIGGIWFLIHVRKKRKQTS